MRADTLTVSPAQVASTKCVQVGLYFTVAGAGNDQDWQSLSMALEYNLNNGVSLSGNPIAQLSDFVGSNNTAEPGITNPGTPLDGSSCAAADVINTATQGGSASNFIPSEPVPNSSGAAAFTTENVNTASQTISLAGLNFSDVFRTDDGTEYLAAIVSFPVAATPPAGSSIEVGFASGTGQNTISRISGTLDANGSTTDGGAGFLEPLACSGATVADNLGTAAGTNIAIGYLDPEAGGNGGSISLTMPHAVAPDRIVVTPDDGSGAITLAGGSIGSGSTVLSLSTSLDGTPATGASVNYQVAYETEFPAGSGNYVAGTSCNLTVNWQSGSCEVDLPAAPGSGEPFSVGASGENLVFDSVNSRFASLAGPQASADLVSPGSTSGTTLTFANALTVNPPGAADYGDYAITGATDAGGSAVACSATLAAPPPPASDGPEATDAQAVPVAPPIVTLFLAGLLSLFGGAAMRLRFR
jgi:hypothetical protein